MIQIQLDMKTAIIIVELGEESFVSENRRSCGPLKGELCIIFIKVLYGLKHASKQCRELLEIVLVKEGVTVTWAVGQWIWNVQMCP